MNERQMSEKPVILVGAGLAGVTGFYELVSRGVPAVLVDAADEVATGASFANGAVLHPSLPDPWNSPGVGRPLLQSLFNPSAAMRLHMRHLPALMGWGLSFLRHSTKRHYAASSVANYALADYSTRQTVALKQKLNLQFEAASPGTLKLFRNAAQKQAALALAEGLAAQGLRYEVLSRDDLVAREPSLASADDVAGALHFPDDMVGNARLFCQKLADEAVALGGQLRLGVSVSDLLQEGGRVVGVRLGTEELRGDVVLTGGVGAPQLARTVGCRLPVRPVKGYSLTVPTQGIAETLPQYPLVDPHLHIAMTPLPGRIRILGMAEFGGFDTTIDPRRADLLRQFFTRLMPDLAAQLDWQAADVWAGLRPMSADGRPFIGPTRIDGLFVNCGHGHLGWTMAVGSARLLADYLTGTNPEIDAAAFAATR